MRKWTPKIAVGIVSAILGFLVMYQYRAYVTVNKGVGYSSVNIAEDVESLTKEKDQLTTTNSQLADKLKKIEESATEETNTGQGIKDQLYAERIQLGLSDVTGDGVRVTIKPKVSMFGAKTKDTSGFIGYKEIVHLVGALWYSGAEAISINDIRITPQTGISDSGTEISIGSVGTINPSDVITVNAIGNTDTMKANLNLEYNANTSIGVLANYNINIEDAKGLVIEKTTQPIQSSDLSDPNATSTATK